MRSADKLLLNAVKDPKVLVNLKDDPVKELTALVEKAKNEATPSYFATNIFVIVVSALGLVGLIAIIGSIVLASIEREIPQVLIALGSAAVGGLVGLISQKSATQSSDETK
jgi:hypothetical protein